MLPCTCARYGKCFPYEISLQKGSYLFEAWGAKGGNTKYWDCPNGLAVGGKGGYSAGIITIKKTTLFFVFVGQEGSSYPSPDRTAYNGGGKASTSGGGGGATDFRLINGTDNEPDSYNSRILVAGAGGGSDCKGYGGVGGGLIGGNATDGGKGGTQESGGAGSSPGSRWQGGSITIDTSAGGGGYFGGGSGTQNGVGNGGGGGSSYISGYPGCTKYQDIVFKSPIIKAGDETFHYPEGYVYDDTNGNGIAQITFLTLCTAKTQRYFRQSLFICVLVQVS